MNESFLYEYYTNPENPGAFSGLSSLIRELKAKKSNIDKSDIKSWMLTQRPYLLHKNIKKKFKRNRVLVAGIDDTWQADLIDLKAFKRKNKGFTFLLTCIDVFSKYAWVIPLKNKTGVSVVEAFKIIFQERLPKRLHTDRGTEFLNKLSEKFLKDNNVKLYYVESELKASVVERFNRTLKEKMWRFFTFLEEKNYIDVLSKFVHALVKPNTSQQFILTK